jgi:hypothetical protein
MNEAHKGFLEYLQTLPDPAKKKVLITATVIIMALVIYFWLAYFNNLIAGISEQASVTENQPAEGVPAESAPAAGPGIWQQLGSGMGFAYGEFVDLAHGLGGVFESSRQYNVQPPQ